MKKIKQIIHIVSFVFQKHSLCNILSKQKTLHKINYAGQWRSQRTTRTVILRGCFVGLFYLFVIMLMRTGGYPLYALPMVDSTLASGLLSRL